MDDRKNQIQYIWVAHSCYVQSQVNSVVFIVNSNQAAIRGLARGRAACKVFDISSRGGKLADVAGSIFRHSCV